MITDRNVVSLLRDRSLTAIYGLKGLKIGCFQIKAAVQAAEANRYLDTIHRTTAIDLPMDLIFIKSDRFFQLISFRKQKERKKNVRGLCSVYICIIRFSHRQKNSNLVSTL